MNLRIHGYLQILYDIWDNLSMTERAQYIKLGVDNGCTNLKNIREAYNSYKKNKFILGGPMPLMLHTLSIPEDATPEQRKQLEEGKRVANKMLHYVPVVNGVVALNNVLSREDTSEYQKDAATASLIGSGITAASSFTGPIGRAVGQVVGTGMSLGDLVYDAADYFQNPSFDGGTSVLLDLTNLYPYLPTKIDDAASVITQYLLDPLVSQ